MEKRNLLFVTIALFYLMFNIQTVKAQWTTQTSGTTNDLNSIYFTGADTGYAVGGLYYQNASNLWSYKNVITKTTDGGTNWSIIYSDWNSWSNIILNSIFFINSNTGWTVGNSPYNSIKKTIDGGSTWVSQYSGTINPLLSVYFVNDSIGFASGNNGTIIKTINGGTNWFTQSSGTTEDLHSIFFVNNNIGYCAGNNSKILKTIDGGASWNVLNSGISSSFKSIKFANANIGYLVGDIGTVVKTSNGGATWTIQTTNISNCLNSISLISQDTLYIAGNYGSILRTVNGGNNWITESSINNTNINSIFFVSSIKGWVVGAGPSPFYPNNMITQGLIAFTNNGGVKQPEATTLNAKMFNNYIRVRGNVHPNGLPTQVYFEYGTTNSYGNIIIADNLPVTTLGEYGVNITGLQMYSTYHFRVKAVNSSGTTYGLDMTFTYINGWTNQESYVTDDLECIQFVNDSIGFIVGYNGTILKTINYGANWILKNSGTYENFSSCFFANKNIGYASTYSGKIYKTINGGDAWSMIKNFGNTINEICFTSSLIGSAVGVSGKIYRTTDGGTTWSSIISGVNSSLKSVTFSRSFSNYGYIVGDNGKFFSTSNNGLNWNLKATGTTKNINSVNAPYMFCVFTVGEDGISINSNSYGNYFNNGNTSTTQNLNSNYFINDTLGFAVGDNGIIIKTTNNAMNWSSQQINSINDLNSVYFINSQSGWAVGENGTILHTNTGGCSNVEIISQSSNISKCIGQNNIFSVTAVGQFINYKWYKNNTLMPNSNNSNYLVSNISQSDTGSYFCIVYNECSSDTSVVVTLGVLPSPIANAGSDVSICIGSSTILNATGGSFYSWGPSNGLSATNISNPIANPLNTITYTVTVSNANGCMSTDNVVVNVNQLINAFNLSSPPNGSWTSANPSFLWESSSGATFYQLYLDGVLKKNNITTTSYQILPTEAINNGMHTWYVVASNYGCTTQSSNTWSVFVDATQPNVFNLTSPTNNSWTNNLQPTLSWSASSDANSGLAKYQLWIDGSLNRDNISSSVTSTTPLNNLSNGTHTWMIKAIDNVGNVRNSTQTRTIKIDKTPPGYYDNSTKFAYNDYAISNNNITINNIITMEAWIKVSGWHSYDRGIMDVDPTYLAVINGNKVMYRYYQGSNNWSSGRISNTILIPNIWYHIAIVHNASTGSLKMYINGLLDVSFTGNTGQISSISKLNYGRASRNGYTYFNGYIDEVRVWNIERTQSQIQENMNSVIEGSCVNGLVGYWRNNDNIGNSTVADYSSFNNHCTLMSGAFLKNELKSGIILGGLSDLKKPYCLQYIQSVTPSFSWSSAQDTGIGFQKFQLFIDGNLVKDNLSDSMWTITNPLSYGEHSWFVKGFDSLGNNQSTYRRTFYIDNAKPNVFNLISPANNQIVNLPTPNFSWQSATDSTGGSGMSKYQLWINGVVNRDSIQISQTTASPSNILPQGAYTWFIKAYDKVGNIRQSSQSNTFYVDWQTPSAFTLIEPIHNVTISVSRPLFKWHASSDIGSGIDKYELCISGQTPITILSTDTTKLLTFDLANGTYTWYVKAFDLAGAFTSSNTNSLTINVPLPNQATTPTGTSELCVNGINTDYTTLGATYASSYIWEISPTAAGTISGTGLIGSVNWNNTFTGNAQIKVKGHNTVGDGLVSNPISVTVYPSTIPGTISGGSNICLGTSTATLTLSGNTGNILKWQKRINNGSWIDIINTTNTYCEMPTIVGIWEYRAEIQSGVCSPLFSATAIVNVGDIPNVAGTILGFPTVCQGQNSVSYSVPTITNATSYVWILPSGATGTSTTNNITVDYSTSAVSGNITVKGQNACGDGTVSSLAITVNPLPTIAGIITGSTTVCQGQNSVSYSVPTITNATSYVWTLPSGATGTSTTNSITVNYSISAVSGNITVKGHNSCGDGVASSLAITVNPLPVSAGTITGLTTVCQGQNTVSYSVPTITNATSYVWILPSGATGTSTTNNITVDYSTSAVSGNITVKGQNACGDGTVSSLAITVNPLPTSAGTITGLTTVCQGQNSISYSVPTITNATTYVWTLPSGATGTSTTNNITVNYSTSAVSGNITVKGQNACGDGTVSSLTITVNPLPTSAGTITGLTTVCQGQNSISYSVPTITNATSYAWNLPTGAAGTSTTNSITVNYSTSAVSGNITVKGQNTCGDGTVSSLSITVNPLPTSAGIITGSTTVCQGQNSISYSVPTITNAISYVWTLPNGATGTSTTNSITINYSTSAVSGSITVKGQNSCGDGDSSILAVTVNPLPISAGIITGSTTVCQGQNSISYSVPTITNATSYVWILPTGATGTSTTNSITVNYSTSAISGNITVKGQNSCGDGDSSILAVTVNPLPVSAGIITGSTTVCQGQNSVSYSVPSITNAASYVWTLPSGAAGTSTTNSITVNYSTSAISGNITVKGQNACGDGTVSSLAITVNPLPISAGTITGSTTVCQEQNSVSYSVPTITNATTYVWTLPSGAIGTSTTNNIIVNYSTSAVSGNITVKGQNACGDGDSSSLAIIVNIKPITPIITINGNVLHSDAILGNQWYNQNGAITGATNQDYSPTVNGDYYVIVTLNGCSSDTSNTINISTGIKIIEYNKRIKVYPNPVSNDLIIEYKENNKDIVFEIYNSIGQIVFSGTLLKKAVIQTLSFSPGVYLIKFDIGKTFEFKKIVKE